MSDERPPLSGAAGKSDMQQIVFRSIRNIAILLLPIVTAQAGAQSWPTDILDETFGYGPDTPSDVPWKEVMQACGFRDCIPSLDAPNYVTASDAGFLDESDLVMAIEIDGDARAFPIAILNFHEIVNDEIGNRPVAITYCPLCGSGMAFHRNVGGRTLDFGVSGLLRNSDLILYDRATESLWQQITGRAFAGPLRGQSLEFFPVTLTQWSKWRSAHPHTLVLSTDTGFDRPYTKKSPYGNYDSRRRLLFPVSFDRKLHPKTVVHGVEVDGKAYAVTAEALAASGTIKQPGSPGVQWTIQTSGEVQALRLDNSDPLVTHRMFWFAWYSFHTTTEIQTQVVDRR